jgi:hypothetical protein
MSDLRGVHGCMWGNACGSELYQVQLQYIRLTPAYARYEVFFEYWAYLNGLRDHAPQTAPHKPTQQKL